MAEQEYVVVYAAAYPAVAAAQAVLDVPSAVTDDPGDPVGVPE
jgi:hypothetical protein